MADDPVDIVARTVWGESRGCGAAGMRNVASAIHNRALAPSWWGVNLITVCRKPWQFSCWNPSDPNLPKLRAVTEADPEFAMAVQIANQVVAGTLLDATNGADSYYAASMGKPPAWAAKARRTFSDGWHIFFRTIVTAPGPSPDVRNVSVHTTAASYPPDEADLLDAEFNPQEPT